MLVEWMNYKVLAMYFFFLAPKTELFEMQPIKSCTLENDLYSRK